MPAPSSTYVQQVTFDEALPLLHVRAIDVLSAVGPFVHWPASRSSV